MKVVFEKPMEIKTIVKNRKHIATAKSIEPLKVEWVIAGNSIQEATNKFNKQFEGCEISYQNTKP